MATVQLDSYPVELASARACCVRPLAEEAFYSDPLLWAAGFRALTALDGPAAGHRQRFELVSRLNLVYGEADGVGEVAL